jgi:hypothetical protein
MVWVSPWIAWVIASPWLVGTTKVRLKILQQRMLPNAVVMVFIFAKILHFWKATIIFSKK